MLEQGFRFRALFQEIESDDRIDARLPVGHAPSLNDTFVRNEFEMSADDAPAEEREGAARVTADFCRVRCARRTALLLLNVMGHLVELRCVGQNFVDSLAIRLENQLLMKRL